MTKWGAIRPGLRADLLVISRDDNAPYRAVVDAVPSDIGLVVIDGTPLLGERGLMERFFDPLQLEEILVGKRAKVLATPAADVVAAEIAARLQAALSAAGTTLAHLADP